MTGDNIVVSTHFVFHERKLVTFGMELVFVFQMINLSA